MEEFVISDQNELATVVDAMCTKLLTKGTDSAHVLALHGDLGAGKTTFVQTLARVLGVTEPVTSPTFVVMKGYETEHAAYDQLIHIDAYRIEDVDEMRVLHFATVLSQNRTIICIEWAEHIAELLPPKTVHISFSITESGRIITINE